MKIKKLTALFLVLIMLLSAVPIMASAASVDDLKYSISNGKVTITGCNEIASGELVIPSEIDGYPVTSIGDRAFSDCYGLTSVKIPDSVTSIAYRAFFSCYSLTSITIPDSVTSIGSDAFRECDSLTSIEIPDSVTTIGAWAFSDCDRLTSITVDENNPVYDSRDNCNAIIETATNTLVYGCGNTIIPDSVTSIGDGAFYGCTSLTSVTIPDSVTSIGNYAFGGCDSLKSVTIGNGVTTIGDGAFSDCDSLTSITVDENNPVYDSRDNCNAIIETATNTLVCGCGNTIIPDSVTSIGDYAFYDCDSLTSVTIPDGVTSIGDYAFWDCTSLTSITIPASVTSIGVGAFYDCDSLTSVTIPDSVTSIGEGAFYSCDSLTSITIPDSVTSIGDYTFYECDSLTSITIPAGVTSIGNFAFFDCKSLTSITIPASVTSIGGYAFYDCKSLTSITIPDSVTSIDDSAFESCTSLTSVTIGNGVTRIGEDAFWGCDRLTSVTIGNGVTSIGDWAFENCDSLKDVYYNGTEEDWNKIDIGDYIRDYGNDYLLNATIHFIDEHAHTYTHISIPASCTVDGMEYDICSDCGDVINFKVLTATGHNWGEWKTVLEPTGTADGKAERKCSKCGDIESKIIAKLNVVKDDDTGIEIQFRDEFDSNIEIKVEEKFDGKSFQLLDLEYSNSKKQIFDITTYENGVKVQPDGAVTVRIPLPDGFGTKNIFVCYVDTESQNVTQIPAKVVDGFVEFSAEHFSEYAVVELSDKAEKVSISDITVNYKDSAKITPNVTIDGDVEYTTSFTSSDTSVATVDKDGRITTLHKGTTTITCTVTDEYGNTTKDTCTVTVKFQWWQWIIWILLFGFLWY